MTNQRFQILEVAYRPVITAIATKLTRAHDYDADLIADLEQEGRICLSTLKLSNARYNTDAYIRQAMKLRMIDFLRKQHLDRFVSLTDLCDNQGCDVMQDDFGRTQVVRTRDGRDILKDMRDEGRW